MAVIFMPIPRAPAAQIVFSAMGQRYRQTTSFAYLGGAVTETSNLSAEIDARIGAGWMSFRRYKRELYDRPNASLLHLKTQMVKSEVEALLYGCATWTPLEDQMMMMLLRVLGACCMSLNSCIFSYKEFLQRTGCEILEATVRARLLWAEALLRLEDQENHVGRRRAGERGTTWAGVAEDRRVFGITGD